MVHYYEGITKGDVKNRLNPFCYLVNNGRKFNHDKQIINEVVIARGREEGHKALSCCRGGALRPRMG